MSKIVLNGITWGHSRGITPLFATAQRFSELHPDVQINWKKRTLQEFADYPIEKLTKEYDLLIIDHPWVGCAAATKCVLPLDEYLAAEYLQGQLNNSVGYSHKSYNYEGHQWALAVDAATPVASYRPDLLEKNDAHVPGIWAEVISLAKRGKLAVPSIPIDLTDDYWYCPFAYGYSNYSRRGYARSLLKYANIVGFESRHPFRSTLGGTGLAVSTFTKHKEWAIRYTQWVVSPEIQSTLYVQNGGQPGHRSAWISEEANRNCNQYFGNTINTLDQAFVRPRYNGYLRFQEQAGVQLQSCLLTGSSPEKVLEDINELYRISKKTKRT